MKVLGFSIVAVSILQFCFVPLLGAEEIGNVNSGNKSQLHNIPVQPTLYPENNTTTVAPNSSTTTVPTTTPPPTTTTKPTTPTTSPTTTATPPTTSTTSTTPAPTTTSTTVTPPTTTPTPTTTTAKPTVAPSPRPEPDRKFDGPSFIGGIVFTLGLMVIGFISWKFYLARTGPNYHIL